MTTKPRTREEIYQSMRDSLTGKITKLTNFTDRSFNYVWTQAFSEEVRELEVLATVAELAGWIDYTGGPITDSDLNELDIESDVTAEEINKYMQDDFLDEYVKIVGVERLPGTKATGTVDFETQIAETTIPEGTRVTTSPSEGGETIDFLTTASATTPNADNTTIDDATTAPDVPIEAVDVGRDYNLPVGSIVRLAEPPTGVRGVEQNERTTDGIPEESNEELRARAKRAIESSSLGGTADGIKGYLRKTINGVGIGDVIIDEYTDPCPPYVDVIVDGGDDTAVKDAIDFSRPTGIRHNFTRPQITRLGFDVDLRGDSIDLDPDTGVPNDIENFLLSLGISENFYRDEMVRLIMNADENIINIDNLGGTIERITHETFEHSTAVNAAIADDGGTLTDETGQANDDSVSNDMTLLPSSPAVGDAYYFGSDEIFSELEVTVSTAGAGTWDIVWEYYDGSSWVQPTNISDGTSDFQNSGTGIISWDIPSDWVSTGVDGGTPRYYLRARVDTFTDITTQPLGGAANITGSGYQLNFTYESTNGSITVEDASGVTYNEGSDYVVQDHTGDGWPETLIWVGGKPGDEESFYVDYDVTVPDQTANGDKYRLNLVRDEELLWNENYSESETYTISKDRYELEYVPFDGSSSITDESGDTYTEGTEYEIIDNTGNGFPQTIDWTGGTGTGTPLDNEDFTITYNQKVYTTEYDLRDTPEGIIRDRSGDAYQEDTEYKTVDYTADSEKDAISWLMNPSSLSNGETFYFTYLTEGDKYFSDRQKADPGTINVSTV